MRSPMMAQRMSTSLFDLAGRVAVVGGGTSGIGRTVALGLADAGAGVVATGRREALVREAASSIEARGRRTLRGDRYRRRSRGRRRSFWRRRQSIGHSVRAKK